MCQHPSSGSGREGCDAPRRSRSAQVEVMLRVWPSPQCWFHPCKSSHLDHCMVWLTQWFAKDFHARLLKAYSFFLLPSCFLWSPVSDLFVTLVKVCRCNLSCTLMPAVICCCYQGLFIILLLQRFGHLLWPLKDDNPEWTLQNKQHN